MPDVTQDNAQSDPPVAVSCPECGYTDWPTNFREVDASNGYGPSSRPISPPSPAETPPNVGRATRQFERKMLAVDRSRDPLDGARHIATVVYDDEAGTISVERPTETPEIDACMAISPTYPAFRKLPHHPTCAHATEQQKLDWQAATELRQAAGDSQRPRHRQMRADAARAEQRALNGESAPTETQTAAPDDALIVEMARFAVSCLSMGGDAAQSPTMTSANAYLTRSFLAALDEPRKRERMEQIVKRGQSGSPRAAQPATTQLTEDRKACYVRTVQWAIDRLIRRRPSTAETNGMADLRCLRDWLAELPSPTTPSARAEDTKHG